MFSGTDFKSQSIELIKNWKDNGDNENTSTPWEWITVQQLNNDSKGYLTTKRYKFINDTNNNNSINTNEEIKEIDEIKEEIDISTLNKDKTDTNKVVILFQYDIIYSNSYQVPVLYLNAFNKNSSLSSVLSWDEIWNLLPLSKQSSTTMKSYITQVEHPILGFPCYQLHPCETNNLMKLILNKNNELQVKPEMKEEEDYKKYYLKSWLSIISPMMVGLKIPFETLFK